MGCDQMLLLILLALASYTHGAENRSVLIYGDSVSAGYGMTQPESWPALLGADLAPSHPELRLANSSVSGETTTGGLNRFKKALEIHAPGLVVLELGGNDGLRGYPISSIQANIGKMIALCQAQNIEVILIGMVLPPNYGRRYTEAFEGLYRALAEQYELAGFLPYLLNGINTDPNLIQRDGIHPTVAAQPLIKDQIKPFILRWLMTGLNQASIKPAALYAPANPA